MGFNSVPAAPRDQCAALPVRKGILAWARDARAGLARWPGYDLGVAACEAIAGAATCSRIGRAW